MTSKKAKLVIIDGNALIHRSFHALPLTMRLKDGRPTNAVYGFTSVLIKALREFKPEYIALTFDMAGPTFRHEQFEDYKAHREKAPDELYAQIPMIQELVSAFNIPIYQQSGFEADDMIGTICSQAGDELEKIIVTGDMDTLQLIDGHTRVYTMSRGMSDSVLYGPDEVKERYGFGPELVIDYKALRGDTSDNIPGVKGIGEKTAVELLKEFGSLDGVYDNIGSEKIRDHVRTLLKEGKENAYMSKDLATIKRDVPFAFDLAATRSRDLDKERLMAAFEALEFRSLLPRLKNMLDEIGHASESVKEKTGSATFAGDKFERDKTEFKYHLVASDKDFEKFLGKLKKQKQFSFDTETTGIDPMCSKLLGVSFSWQEGEAYYLDFSERSTKVKQAVKTDLFSYAKIQEKNDDEDAWLKALAPIFADEKIAKNSHNAKFDIRVLGAQGLVVQGLGFDTMIASYLLDPSARQHGLDQAVLREFLFEKISKEDLLGTGKSKKEYGTVEREKLYVYSCEDADFCQRLFVRYAKMIEESGLSRLMADIELPLVPVLAKMENEGIALDKDFLASMETELARDLMELEKKIFDACGCVFNVRSTQQLGAVLFEKMGISADGIKKNKKGFSTAFDELEKLKDKHPAIALIQEHRELSKLQSTYVEALPKLVSEKTGRVHTSFNQTVAATGRLSSTDPNLQNIPVRTEIGKRIRRAFVAAPGFDLFAFDYSQIELRIAAHLSGDKNMIAAFAAGADIHASTAALIAGVDIADVTPQMRREAKAVNFGVLYGQGPHGLAQGAEISFDAARKFIEDYFAAYSGVKEMLDQTIAFAREHSYVETMFGRRRPLADINSKMPMLKKAAERMAVNTPIQGTAADLIKLAMIAIHKEILDADARLLLQVHDELVFEIREGTGEGTVAKIRKIMENVIKLKVDLKVDVKVGKNWGQMEKYS